jgi:hypothetical protein
MDCIAGCQYMPSVAYFAHWLHSDHFLIEQHEHFQKRSWRNRTCILSDSEPLMLIVPLRKGKHQQRPVTQVEIAYDEPWIEKHIHGLQTAYGKTAFGEEVLESIKPILKKEYPQLWHLNLELLHCLTSLISSDWPYQLTASYQPLYSGDVLDLRAGVACGTLPGKIAAIPTYPQVQRIGKAFQSNLTILDVLCHLGPESLQYIRQFAAWLYTDA